MTDWRSLSLSPLAGGVVGFPPNRTASYQAPLAFMRATGGHQAPLLALMLLTGVRLHLYPPTWTTSPKGTLTTTKAEPPRFGACNRRAIAPARPRHRVCSVCRVARRRGEFRANIFSPPSLSSYTLHGTSSPQSATRPNLSKARHERTHLSRSLGSLK